MTFRRSAFSLAICAAVGLMFMTGGASAQETAADASGKTAEPVTIVTLAKRSGKFRQFLHAAKVTGLDADLSGKGPLTVFAPTDDAFGKLPNGIWFKLLQPENRELLTEIVRFHTVPGHYPPQRLLNASAKRYTIPGAGGPILIDIRKGPITVQGYKADEEFFAAENGLVQAIDGVLMPKGMKAKLEALK